MEKSIHEGILSTDINKHGLAIDFPNFILNNLQKRFGTKAIRKDVFWFLGCKFRMQKQITVQILLVLSARGSIKITKRFVYFQNQQQEAQFL